VAVVVVAVVVVAAAAKATLKPISSEKKESDYAFWKSTCQSHKNFFGSPPMLKTNKLVRSSQARPGCVFTTLHFFA